MSLDLPDFRSETEEADWWSEHREEVEAEFMVAAAEGRLTQTSADGGRVVAPLEVDAADLEQAGSILRIGHQPITDTPTHRDALRRAS